MPTDSPRDWPAVRVTGLLDAGAPLRWFQGLSFHWPRVVLSGLTEGSGPEWGSGVVAGRELRLRRPASALPWTDADRTTALDAIAYTGQPLSARLPFSYQLIPHQLRWLAACALLRLRGPRDTDSGFPSWPLDLSLDSLADLSAFCADAVPPAAPWRDAALLTHDIDTPESLRNLPRFLELEEKAGMRSTCFIVPCAWPLDHGILRRAADAGHELGLHGYNHDNRTPFLPASGIRNRLDEAAELMERYGMKGFRSPSLLRTPGLLAALSGRFAWDSSFPAASAAYSAQATGVASARPLRLQGMLELPLTMPTDAALRFMGREPSAILELWKSTAATLRRSGGLLNLLTHCEARYSGNAPMLEAYRLFLQHLRSAGYASWTLSQVKEAPLAAQRPAHKP